MPPAPRPQSVLAAAMANSAAPGVIGTEGQLRFVGLCAILLSGHLLAALVPGLGRRVVSESLFLADSALALYCLNRARLRSCGSARTFWLLFLSALGVFAGANILWFCELVVGRFPFESLLVLSYRLYAVPVAMTFFVREGGEGQSGCGKERALDFLQLGILTWLAVFVLYYLPSRSLTPSELARFGAVRLGNTINLVLLGLCYVRWRMEDLPELRGLRARLVAFVAAYSIVAAAGNFIDLSGFSVTWFDGFWALPYLLVAAVATYWDPACTASDGNAERRSLPSLLIENLAVAAICLAVAVLSDHVPEPWHLLASVAVGVSLLAYSARLTLSQHRQAEELQARKLTEKKLRQAHDQLAASLEGARARAVELNLLTELGHFLQACANEEEAYQLVGSALKQIVPECSGALYKLAGLNQQAGAVRQWGTRPPARKNFEAQSCWALRRNRPHTSNDRGHVVCSHLEQDEARASLCVPLAAGGELSGALVLVIDADPRSQGQVPGIFTKARRVGQAVADQMGLTLSNLRLRAAMQEQAIRDPLTGLYNRRHLEEMLRHELLRAERQQRPLSLLMLDLDHFKRINDTLGHDAGDAVLRAVGAFLRANVRSADVPCRFGGEEFVVLMPEALLADAARRAQEICDGIRQIRIEHPTPPLGPPTASIGVASLSPGASTGSGLLQAADAALYGAKQSGRNCVAVNEDGQISVRRKEVAQSSSAGAGVN